MNRQKMAGSLHMLPIHVHILRYHYDFRGERVSLMLCPLCANKYLGSVNWKSCSAACLSAWSAFFATLHGFRREAE
jgi:hypothetical protein